MSQPSLKQLSYILAVAKNGSFRGAADELGISQPTLTAQIARAEEALGEKLLERSRNGAYLTPVGRLFEPQARRVIEAMEELGQIVGDTNINEKATYRLGVKGTLGPYLLPQILPALKDTHPNLQFYVREDTPRGLEEGIARGDYDVIITALPVNSKDLVQEPLLREKILLAAPADHSLTQVKTWRGSYLKDEQVLTTEQGHQFARLVEGVCQRLGAQVRRDYEGSSLDALRLMVVMGMGLTFLPALYVESEINADSGIAVGELADETIARLHVLAWRPSSPARGFYKVLAKDLRMIIAQRLGHAVEIVNHL
ncbi:hydrogen peroxide-inducible genes activator [Congregibacter brevis]|uniref:Hydrogen peroxide-inducible genes activator n=1 Tax=Congregibacter brevis TaxID=3081201 RepID=A0ABZ0IDC6_9GAMM|nr:hydrogen peroxide-inducible genes activator [Congregibacter sp. IMCC45268]